MELLRQWMILEKFLESANLVILFDKKTILKVYKFIPASIYLLDNIF